MRSILLTLFGIAMGTALLAQNLKLSGTVIDELGQPMPYVNVYLTGTTQGTTTNGSGYFTLTIAPQAKKGTLGFKFVGYEVKTLPVSNFVNSNPKIALTPQQVSLSEVVVTAKGKDPAYYIMRQAIANRKKFQYPTDAYTADLYMKGRAFFAEAPDTNSFLLNMMMKDEDMKEMKEQEGQVLYLTESFSKLSFERPNKVKEELLASRQTGTAPGFSSNRGIFLDNNFYSNRIEDVNERGAVSPLSSQAMLFYNFKLLGKFTEDGQTINRIQVTPKRKGDPVFTGEIYIVHDRWNIHSLDLGMHPEAVENPFVDSVNYKTVYKPVDDSVWMPLSLQTEYFFKIFGFKVAYEIVGQYSEYDIQTTFEEDFFGNEVYAVNDTVRKNDTLLMNRLRPVTLDSLEARHYFESDSTAAVQNSPAYKDSVRKASNRFRLGSVLGGYSYRYANNNTLSIGGALDGLTCTAVDGFVIQPRINYWVRDEENRTQDQFTLTPRYAFARKHLDLAANWTHYLKRLNQSSFFVGAGTQTRQINARRPISGLYELYYTYFDERNYGQYLSESFVRGGYAAELFNGFYATFSASYRQRENLQNLPVVPVYKNIENRSFTPNLNAQNLGEYVAFSAYLRYRIKQKYASYPGYRVRYRNNKYPELNATLTYAPEGLSTSSYVFTEFGLTQDFDLGLFGTTAIAGYYGNFFNNSNQSFFDFKHFMGNQIPFINGQNRGFQALPYYGFSTNQGYVELHARHNFNGFIFNKIPFLRNQLNCQFYGGANALIIPSTSNNFYEAYVGLENLFTFLSLQVAAPLVNGSFQNPRFQLGVTQSF